MIQSDKVNVTISYQVCTLPGTHEKVLWLDVSMHEKFGVNTFNPVDLAEQKIRQK
jgi:hypothetical protein